MATPGRLFDHMRSKEFDYRFVKCLVLDEADKIFQYEFEEDLKQIVNRLPSKSNFACKEFDENEFVQFTIMFLK